ncbi:MAG: sterol-binding protein, partial [Gammaproteobacteria bacterium]|nr:sterol-binding protein [Gammaproteobacteria bacterium]
MRLPALIGSVIEDALNRYLAMDPDSAHRLESIQAKAIALDLRGLDLTLFILVRPPRLSVLTELEAAPDTRLRGTPLGLLSMGLGEGGARQLFGGDVEIEGDIETGQRLQAILQAVEIDWEEQISRLTGDVVAHQVGNLARGARDYW